eukprot:CAMPEP_0116050656 /NCGR_PEP_ID=MMETSP0322-20121206/515_1 /TAXON_ID=163516 /ORGANISM="Leptocylindrus danicus var. apora, Strain B651" /LENGTH=539 /DNA_ID=CAMNT_0003533257 /DNA_START=11 /DNA_END=1630 /DNA_ORIENTATION=+
MTTTNTTSGKLREALAELHGFTNAYANKSKSGHDADSVRKQHKRQFHELKARYLAAREKYIRHRIMELVTQCVTQEEDDDNNENSWPECDLDAAMEEQRKCLGDIRTSVDDVVVRYEALLSRYHVICSQEGELGSMLRDLEVSKDEDGDMTMDMNDVDEVENEDTEYLSKQQLELDNETKDLLAQKTERAATIQKLQSQIQQINEEQKALTEKIESMQGGNEIVNRDVEDVRQEVRDVQEKIEELRKMANWYDEVRATMEHLSGLSLKKVDIVDHVPAAEAVNCDNNGKMLEVHIGLHPYSDDDDTNEVYVLAIQLQQQSRAWQNRHKYPLRVFNARMVGEQGFIKSSDDAIKSAVITSSELDEIVKASNPNLKLSSTQMLQQQHQQIKFIARETLARIRGNIQRVHQIELLRQKHLVQIEYTPTEASYDKYGSIDSVICSLNDGITVVLRLTPDCPLLPGSTYIEQMVGLGGWEQKTMRGITDKVNSLKLRSAPEVMHRVKNEIQRISMSQKPRDVNLQMYDTILGKSSTKCTLENEE